MCYDIKTQLKTQLKYALRYTPELVPAILEELKPHMDPNELEWYHVSGFAHPKMFIYKSGNPLQPVLSQWGLIPSWVKDKDTGMELWNNTLNARGETIFEKPSFRDAAKTNRCVLVVDGFYEHHHHKGKTYPFYIHRKDNEPMTLAGLWSEWVDKSTGEVLTTHTIVTSQGNSLLSKIHNNPKLDGPRMPVILPDGTENTWLDKQQSQEKLAQLILPFTDAELAAHPVQKLRGKNSLGNDKRASEEFTYAELEF